MKVMNWKSIVGICLMGLLLSSCSLSMKKGVGEETSVSQGQTDGATDGFVDPRDQYEEGDPRKYQNICIERPTEAISEDAAREALDLDETGVNANGDTYGPSKSKDFQPGDDDYEEWDLIPVSQNSVTGYVYSAQIDGDHYIDPDSGREYVPVYSNDGVTLRGYFFFNE